MGVLAVFPGWGGRAGWLGLFGGFGLRFVRARPRSFRLVRPSRALSGFVGVRVGWLAFGFVLVSRWVISPRRGVFFLQCST